MNDHDVYRVAWSEDDGEYVATVDRFPSMSWLSTSPVLALHGLVELVDQADEDMQGGHHPCDGCGAPWSACMNPTVKHDGAIPCCAACYHPYQCAYGDAVNAPLSEATIAALTGKLRSGDVPVRRVPVRPSEGDCGVTDD